MWASPQKIKVNITLKTHNNTVGIFLRGRVGRGRSLGPYRLKIGIFLRGRVGRKGSLSLGRVLLSRVCRQHVYILDGVN